MIGNLDGLHVYVIIVASCLLGERMFSYFRSKRFSKRKVFAITFPWFFILNIVCMDIYSYHQIYLFNDELIDKVMVALICGLLTSLVLVAAIFFAGKYDESKKIEKEIDQ